MLVLNHVRLAPLLLKKHLVHHALQHHHLNTLVVLIVLQTVPMEPTLMETIVLLAPQSVKLAIMQQTVRPVIQPHKVNSSYSLTILAWPHAQ